MQFSRSAWWTKWCTHLLCFLVGYLTKELKDTQNQLTQTSAARDSLQPYAGNMCRDQLKVPEKCVQPMKRVLNLQRGGWGDMSPEDLYKGAKEAFDTGLKPFLPQEMPARVMDIGCGMALYDNFLFQHYNFSSNLHLYLLDKTISDTDELEASPDFVGGGWHPDGQFSFYTNLECAAQILRANSATFDNVHPLMASLDSLKPLATGSFDMIHSLLSYGHHYPVSTYLAEVHRLLRVGGTLILDLRTHSSVLQGLKELLEVGFECETVRSRRRGKTVKCFKRR